MDRVRDISVQLSRGAHHHKAQEVPKKQARESNPDGMDANIASEQDVIMAYRLILGREPENSAAVVCPVKAGMFSRDKPAGVEVRAP
jgi:hypothetical protein